jgi:hypothetical protein
MPDRCDWPACSQPAAATLDLEPGMTLTVGGEPIAGRTFRVCREHAPKLGRIGLDGVRAALRRRAARQNFAPGDAEWNEEFDR